MGLISRYTLGIATWSADTNPVADVALDYSMHIVRVEKTSESSQGFDTIYLAQWGTDPDGSGLRHWSYNEESGWFAVEDLVDTTRTAVDNYLLSLGASTVNSDMTEAEYTEAIAYLNSL